ncbi:MAG: ATP-binding protein [Thermoplasmatota archaeon]|nr:PAS domain-containing protein [Candidatus Thermoplasmatota archaeon]MBU1915402.1 PAS domain-containing protein [Candidatus Thermoplasmatota archaeon]
MSQSNDYESPILKTLHRLSAKMQNLQGSEEGFRIIADELRSIANSDYAAVFLVDNDNSTLKLVGLSGFDRDKAKSLPVVKVDEEYRRQVFGANGPRILKLRSQSDFPSVAQDLAKATDMETGLLSPIMLRGEFLGYVAIGNKKGSPDVSETTEELMASSSDAVAVVIDSMRIYSKLSQAKENTDRILSLAPIGIFSCDPKGIFKSVNRQMLAMLDSDSEQELIGTSVFELPVVTKSGLDALLMQGVEGHEGEKADVHFVLRSDRALYLHVKVTPLKTEKGDVQGLLAVAMDITSKIRLQNQLERSYEKLTQTYQELERVTKMKTQFIDVVSHELRTPLTVMRGYIDLVESEYSAKLEPKFGSRLKIIKANTDKLYGLVESMLDVSRLEKGSLMIHPEPVRIDTILEEIVRTMINDAEVKNQTLILDIEGKLPLIMADRRRLKDVFSNLIDNGLKYTQEGGRIQVSARDEGRMLHIWVKDNGVGIPLENLGKIFDRFHIVTSDDLSHQVNRLGLGLPIAKGIIEAHGGRIWVESQVGKGSVFHVDLVKESPK